MFLQKVTNKFSTMQKKCASLKAHSSLICQGNVSDEKTYCFVIVIFVPSGNVWTFSSFARNNPPPAPRHTPKSAKCISSIGALPKIIL